MGLGEPDLLIGDGDDDGDGGGSALGSCSICLEAVTDDGDRSIAKLQCGHRFHLDCIGSAFNAKGAMQCPNCRKIEKGQWLYGSAGRSFHEFSIDESAQDEDLYDLAEMSIGVHWCPFGGLTHLPSTFDEGEFAATSFHSLVSQNAVYAEHAVAQSTTPYIAYLEAVHPSSSSSSGNLDGSSYNTNWGPSVHSDIPSYAYPAMDVHQHRWEHHSTFPTSINRGGLPDSSITQRAAGPSYDTPRSGSFMSPYLVGSSSAARAGSSVTSSMVPPHPGSVARSRHRVQALQAYFQQQPSNSPSSRPITSSSRRPSTSHRSMPQVQSSMSDQNDGFYYFPPPSSGHNFQESDNPMLNHSRSRLNSIASSQGERDANWGPFHQVGGSDTTSVFLPRHGSDWMTYQSQHHHR